MKVCILLAIKLNDMEKSSNILDKLLVSGTPAHLLNAAVNTIIEAVENASKIQGGKLLNKFVNDIYMKVLSYSRNNLRFWFQTSCRYCNLLLSSVQPHHSSPQDEASLDYVQRFVSEAHKELSSNVKVLGDSTAVSSLSVQVFGVEVLLCSKIRNPKRMKKVYTLATAETAVVEPSIMANIRDIGGRFFLSEKRYEAAYEEFMDAFTLYQSVGRSAESKICLQLCVLAGMLSGSGVSPFTSSEAKAYEDDPFVSRLARLRTAFDRGDVRSVNLVLTEFSSSSAGDVDKLILENLNDFLHHFRLKVLSQFLVPFKKVNMSYLRVELGLKNDDSFVELMELLNDLYSSGSDTIQSKGIVIDQVSKIVYVNNLMPLKSGYQQNQTAEILRHTLENGDKSTQNMKLAIADWAANIKKESLHLTPLKGIEKKREPPMNIYAEMLGGYSYH